MLKPKPVIDTSLPRCHRERLEEPMNDHGESHNRDGQTSEAKIRFKYVIISSRSPTLVGRSWNPEQHFTDTPLTNFMHATQLSHVGASGLLLRLHAPGLSMEETAFDNEDFAEVKMAFNRAIGELKKRLAPNKVARVMMQMEPLYLTPQQKPLWIFEMDQTCEAPRMNTQARRRNKPSLLAGHGLIWFTSPTFSSGVFRLVFVSRKDGRCGGKDEVHWLLPLRTATPLHEDSALQNIDPSLTLLSTTSRVFEGAQGTTLSCVSEAPHLAADTPDMFAESWVFGPREYTCEGCPLQDSSRSVAPLPSQVDQETTMPVPDQALAVCHIRPEQQQCQYGGPRLASETGHNQGITDIMNQQRGSTGSIADFPSDWPDGRCTNYHECQPFEQGHFNYRELRSDAPDGEVLRVPDDWEMAYATGEENFPTPLEEASTWYLPDPEDNYCRFTGGKSFEDFEKLSEHERRNVFRSYLAEKTPILIQEPIAWTSQESIDSFLLLKNEARDNEAGQRLLQEARQVFYEENSFIVLWSDLDRFFGDLLGRWTDATPVKSLVRKITVRIERHECGCGNLGDYLQRTRHFATNLESITFEWWDSWKHWEANNIEEESVGDGTDDDESGRTLKESSSIGSVWEF
ncbi:hypothetical protein MRS44_017774 [Fusarium solani]|uniref:uncharacterized protein n=1 Tax=Fusarium solani TaxID=169388 RepID=UPI0032C4AA2F|nr:hypothetical protein MRS44_017774 [Fusarium solani]